MFDRKKGIKTKVLPPATSVLLAGIETPSTKVWEPTDYEKEFFISLEQQINLAGLSVLSFTAMRKGDGTIRLNHYAGQIGDVHLRKKIGSIRYFIDPYKFYDMEDAPIEAIIAVIPYWVSYASECVKLHYSATH